MKEQRSGVSVAHLLQEHKEEKEHGVRHRIVSYGRRMAIAKESDIRKLHEAMEQCNYDEKDTKLKEFMHKLDFIPQFMRENVWWRLSFSDPVIKESVNPHWIN